MRSNWRDGERTRAVEATPLGEGRWLVTIDDVPVEVHVESGPDGRIAVLANGAVSKALVTAVGDRRFVRLDRLDFVLERSTRSMRGKRGAAGGGLDAPMPGAVTKVLVAAGDDVTKGQPLIALEAMKMEHMIRAPRDGRVKAILAEQGAMVDGGTALVELEETEST